MITTFMGKYSLFIKGTLQNHTVLFWQCQLPILGSWRAFFVMVDKSFWNKAHQIFCVQHTQNSHFHYSEHNDSKDLFLLYQNKAVKS